MELRDIVKVGAGIITGKLERPLLDRVKLKYEIAGVDVAKLGVGIAQAVLADRTPLPEDAKDVVETAGVTLVAEEVYNAAIKRFVETKTAAVTAGAPLAPVAVAKPTESQVIIS